MPFNNVGDISECLINNDICEYSDSINSIVSHIEDSLGRIKTHEPPKH